MQYLEPTDSAVVALMERAISGPVTMLNLLKLRETADYSASPELTPAEPISGRAAYERYIEHTLPFLHESGGTLEFLGEGGPYLIGPPDEGWDLVMLVRQQSVGSFLAFASNQAYMLGVGHRTAAVRDTRNLPQADIVHPPSG